jgi:hypothetical protein
MLYRADQEGHPESPQLNRIYVTLASLVDPVDRAPQSHVSYEERVSWMQFDDGLPKHRGKTDEEIEE